MLSAVHPDRALVFDLGNGLFNGLKHEHHGAVPRLVMTHGLQ